MADDQTINLPQLLLVIFLGGVAIKYFFFGKPATESAQQSSSATRTRAREEDVQTIQQMFPQVQRRSIMWDLQRNGGNLAATSERILSGRGLEDPPQTFQPPLPVPASSPASSTASPPTKVQQPDLITRYNLSSKVAMSAEPEIPEPASSKQAWSQNKGERQALLQRRRDEMILAARKRMEAKVAAEAVKGDPAAE